MLKRLLIVLGIVVALGLLVWGLMYVLGKAGRQPSVDQQVETPSITGQLPEGTLPDTIEQPPVVPIQQKPQRSEAELEQIRAANFAKDFAARFGTYSNQNFSSNIEDLLPSTTGSATSYLESLLGGFDVGSEYVGITSKALSSRWIEWNTEGVARVLVSLWRVEMRNSETNEGYSQDVELTLIKQNEQWMVSRIEWSKMK